jgi:hypothetical protein
MPSSAKRNCKRLKGIYSIYWYHTSPFCRHTTKTSIILQGCFKKRAKVICFQTTRVKIFHIANKCEKSAKKQKLRANLATTMCVRKKPRKAADVETTMYCTRRRKKTISFLEIISTAIK